MTLQVTVPATSSDAIHYNIDMFFDINNQDYSKHTDPSMIPTPVGAYINNSNNRSGKKQYFNFAIFHNYEDQIKELQNNRDDQTITITNALDPTISDPRIIVNDFLFNRTKAYYCQYPFRKNTKKWYHHGQLSFIVPEYQNPQLKNKIYVTAGKTYSKQRRDLKYRRQLVSLMKERYLNIGHLGNYDDTPELFLYAHIEFPWINNVSDLEAQTAPMHYDWWGYSPPHNEYYRNSFISIYGETIEVGGSIAVTEKTYDPLIKGHFVLPFSTSGFINHLKTLGFKFPDFIDYSYDSVVNNDSRYQMYASEINRLMTMDIDTWRQHYSDNYDIIHHNQLIFHEKPYERINFYDYL
jgi:hypothetical protein